MKNLTRYGLFNGITEFIVKGLLDIMIKFHAINVIFAIVAALCILSLDL